MSTLMLTYATCCVCFELQQPADLTRTPIGFLCVDRSACLRRKAIRLALLPPRREGEGAQETA